MRGISRGLVAAVCIGACSPAHAKTPAPDAAVALAGPRFPVGNLTFTIPARWQIQMVESPARGGQWRVPPVKPDGEPGQVVAFYFGPGIGGSTKENIEAWIGTMFSADGHPAADKRAEHRTAGFLISQVVIFGTYNQVILLPGVPPVARPNYGLIGAVVENPGGNIYWRFTGPEALVTATLPLFDKMLDSVKAEGNATR